MSGEVGVRPAGMDGPGLMPMAIPSPDRSPRVGGAKAALDPEPPRADQREGLVKYLRVVASLLTGG
jgi:hypothetical protein